MENATININYNQTGTSTNTDALGMREMQANVYAVRDKQYLLVKAPPASGKSRAMMYVALYKMKKQGLHKTIVAVPEKSIGGSFKNTNLRKGGFFADWVVTPYFNLCDDGGFGDEESKVRRFKEFLHAEHVNILVCTHATLRFAMKELPDDALNDCFVGIDEFHHTSADANSGLGDVVRRLMANSNAHILAMTGSYFRGDGIPVLRAEDEARFYPVTYNYYQQLNGYRYLKNLQIGYKFYQGKYLSAIGEVLDLNRKTIIHIPAVNSRASTGIGKWGEVDEIIKIIGEVVHVDYDSSRIKTVRTRDGRLLKVADLVEDTPKERNALQSYLRRIDKAEDLDIIIALGTAKEGFDWQWCDTCLTIGVRGSLTEIVQIIGRCTRDCPGKTTAQFINLIAQPDAAQDNVVVAVNDFLKAITASLLMEQVMAPSWNFKTKKDIEENPEEATKDNTIVVEGLKPLQTEKTKLIVAAQLDDLKATILQDDLIVKAIGTDAYAETINNVLIPKVIKEKYPELSQEEVEIIRDHLVLDTVIKGAEVVEQPDGKFLKIANRFINIDKLNINIVLSINPFQRAYEVMSKNINKEVLGVIQDTIAEQHYDMSLEEAILLAKDPLHEFIKEHNGALPNINSVSVKEQRLAQAYQIVKNHIIRIKQGLE